jgi:hypothetical protein
MKNNNESAISYFKIFINNTTKKIQKLQYGCFDVL